MPYLLLAILLSGWTHLTSRSGTVLPHPFDAPQQTASLLIDVDNNGSDDIVLTERTQSPSVVLLRREGKIWKRYVIEYLALHIEAGGAAYDIDGDGDQDIVFGGDYASDEVWWWENPYPNLDPTRGWTRHLIKRGIARKHHDQAFADIDGDGKAELVFWNQGARKLFLARIPSNPRQAGAWPLTEIFSWTGKEMEGLAIDDINADGKPDIVGGGRWFEYTGNDTFREHLIDDTQRFSRVVAGQFRPGGWAEVAFVAGDAVGRLRFYEHNNGEWRSRDLLNQDIVHGHSLRLGDIDKDSHLDLFLAEMGKWIHPVHRASNLHPRTWMFWGDGQGNFTPQLIARGYGIHEGRLGDLDGDGDLDIAAKPYNWDAPRLDVLLNNGNPRQPIVPVMPRWTASIINSALRTQPLFLDTVRLGPGASRSIVAGSAIYRRQANGAWTGQLLGDPIQQVAAIADMDVDGLWDLFGLSPLAAWARNRNNGLFTFTIAGPAGHAAVAIQNSIAVARTDGVYLLTGTNWQQISRETGIPNLVAADIDRDGDQDLLLGNRWLRNDGKTWTAIKINDRQVFQARLGDINLDGQLDAVLSFSDGEIAWYEQPGWTEHNVAQRDRAAPIEVADVNGDMQLDIIAGGTIYGNGSWKPVHYTTGRPTLVTAVDIDDDGDQDLLTVIDRRLVLFRAE